MAKTQFDGISGVSNCSPGICFLFFAELKIVSQKFEVGRSFGYKHFMRNLIRLLPIFVLCACTKPEKHFSEKVLAAGTDGIVYSRDSRVEPAYIRSPVVQQSAQLSVAFINSKNLKSVDSSTVELMGEALQESQNLCAAEKFVEQRVSAFCSGILLDSKHVLTAGHCVFTPEECADAKIIFGFEYRLGSAMNYKIPLRNVFNCRRVVTAEKPASLPAEDEQVFDYSIVELDREAPIRYQVTLNVADDIKRGQGLFTLGYPAGLPKKYADGKVTINNLNSLFFRADLDAYGGNSGAPVFNAKTGALEGILVSGGEDFRQSNEGKCNVSRHCDGNACDGEQVLKISKIKQHLDL